MSETAPETYQPDGQVELLKRQLAEARKSLRERAMVDAGHMAIVNALHELVPVRPEVESGKLQKIGRGVIPASGILDIGDVHFGELVSARSTGGIAEYSPDIARERYDHTIDEAIRLGKQHKIRSIWMIGGGDMISGNIHDDLNRNNEMMTVGQTLEGAEMIYGGLEKLCQAFPDVNFVGVSGNHARTEKIPFFNHKQTESMDYMLYEICRLKGKDQPNLTFHTPESFYKVIEVEDRKILTMHGDTIKQQNSMGLPYYGFFKEYWKWGNMRDSVGDFQDMMFHHFHTPTRLNMGNNNLFVNGALKGKDDYSLAGSRLPAPASQRFLTVAGGEIDADYLISSEHIQGK